MKILCTICARKNSKGLSNKNFRKLGRKNLIFHSIDQALKVKKIENIVISTDVKLSLDDLKKRNLNQFFLRSKNLASDSSGKVRVIKDALIRSEKYFGKVFDLVIDLDVTSPLRHIKDIKNCINQIIKEKTNNLITVCRARKNPYFNMIELNNNCFPKLVKKTKKNILRRQDAPKVFDMNASIYIWKRKFLMNNIKLYTKKTSIYEMPFNRSIDIDSVDDLNLVRYFIKKR